MTVVTQADRDICASLAPSKIEVSPREVRTLREYGVIEAVGGGGRGKSGRYIPGTVEAVAGVELAKTDPDYRRKLHRAVLIAWVRGAPIGDTGFRWAYREHFRAEERSAANLLYGKRAKDHESDVRLDPKVHQVLAKAQNGDHYGSEDLGMIEKTVGPTLRALVWESEASGLFPVSRNNSKLGLSELRTDGTWRVSENGAKAWELMALAPQREVALTAPPEELEAARDGVRPMFAAIGAEVTDWVVAGQAPGTALQMRQSYGTRWWIEGGKR